MELSGIFHIIRIYPTKYFLGKLKTDRVNSCRNVSVLNTVSTNVFAVKSVKPLHKNDINHCLSQACRGLTNQRSVCWKLNSLSEDKRRLEACLLSSLYLIDFLNCFDFFCLKFRKCRDIKNIQSFFLAELCVFLAIFLKQYSVLRQKQSTSAVSDLWKIYHVSQKALKQQLQSGRWWKNHCPWTFLLYSFH